MSGLDQLTLQLAYSATLEEMHSAHPPRREVRIAHNYARRLLTDTWGADEAERAFGAAEMRRLFRVFPMMMPAVLISGAATLLFGLSGLRQRLDLFKKDSLSHV